MTRKKKHPDFADYVPIEGEDKKKPPLNRRIAHFMDWAARNMPKRLIPYNLITKAINNYRHLPRESSKEVETIKSAMPRVKKVLLEDYERGFHSKPHLGARATVDSEDILLTDLATKARRRESLTASMERVADIVDPSSLPATEQGKQLKSFHREVKKTNKLLDESRIKRLLPPKQ